jgi:hypothetical protein
MRAEPLTKIIRAARCEKNLDKNPLSTEMRRRRKEK